MDLLGTSTARDENVPLKLRMSLSAQVTLNCQQSPFKKFQKTFSTNHTYGCQYSVTGVALSDSVRVPWSGFADRYLSRISPPAK